MPTEQPAGPTVDSSLKAPQGARPEPSVSVSSAEGPSQVDGVPLVAVAAMVASVAESIPEIAPRQRPLGRAGETTAVGHAATKAEDEGASRAPSTHDASDTPLSLEEVREPPPDEGLASATERDSAVKDEAPSVGRPAATVVVAVMEELERHFPWTPMLSYPCPFVSPWCVTRPPF